MVTRPDTVTGAGEQSLTPQALPSSRNTYCSLFLAHIHKHHRGLVTHPHWNHWNLPPAATPVFELLPVSIISFTQGPIKLESGYEARTESRTSQPFIKLSVTARGSTHAHTHKHAKLTRPTETGTGERKNKMITSGGTVRGKEGWRKRRRGNQMRGKWSVRRQVVRRTVTAAFKVYQHSRPTISTIYKMWKYCYLCGIRDTAESRGSQVCSKTMWRNATPLFFFFYIHTLSQGHWSSGQFLLLFLKVSFSLRVKSSQLLRPAGTRALVQACAHAGKLCLCVCVCAQVRQLSSVALREHMQAKNKNHTVRGLATFSHSLDVFIRAALFCYILMGLFAPGKHFQRGTKQQWFEGNTA